MSDRCIRGKYNLKTMKKTLLHTVSVTAEKFIRLPCFSLYDLHHLYGQHQGTLTYAHIRAASIIMSPLGKKIMHYISYIIRILT